MGGQGGCERRIEVFFVKIQKKKIFFGGGGRGGWVREGGGVGSGWGGQGGCERRIEVFFGKFTQKNRGVGGREGRGQVGGRFGGGVRVDVNAMLGVGGDVGYGVCEPRIEVLYNVQKGIVQY